MIYIVSGIHRSGTSLMMGALNRSGIPAFYDAGRESAMQKAQVERGYIANKQFWEVGENKYMSLGYSRYVPDDHCVKIAFKGLALLAGGISHKIIIMRRDPSEIRSSCKKAFPEMDFDKFYKNRWLDYYAELIWEVKQHLTSRVNCEFVEIDFKELVTKPYRTFDKLSKFIPINPALAAEEVDITMVRYSNVA